MIYQKVLRRLFLIIFLGVSFSCCVNSHSGFDYNFDCDGKEITPMGIAYIYDNVNKNKEDIKSLEKLVVLAEDGNNYAKCHLIQLFYLDVISNSSPENKEKQRLLFPHKIELDQENPIYQRIFNLTVEPEFTNNCNDYWKCCKEASIHRQAIYDFEMGDKYAEGKGIAKNTEEAFHYYKLSADQGHKFAQCNIGHMYGTGNGVAKNIKEALRYYKLAADQGEDVALYSLGLIYAEGKSVIKNMEEAFHYYKLAADQGHQFAQCNIGRMYETGDGVTKNIKEALRYYKLAEKNKIPLYNHYEDGSNVDEDNKENDSNQCNIEFLSNDTNGIRRRKVLGHVAYVTPK